MNEADIILDKFIIISMTNNSYWLTLYETIPLN